MSLPEVLLWQVLRTRPDGHRFRRQAPAGDYVLDFYCAPARLAIEVDGEAHSRGDRPARDGARAMLGWSSAGSQCCACRPRTCCVISTGLCGTSFARSARASPLHHQPEEGWRSPVWGRSCPRHDLGLPGAIQPHTPAARGRI
ncbi:endonuclease domain-containing protein [Sphingomonas glacialis]|uniref:endonuclease domain-containing protein n=1 Tax=Sphingomonas glacialis TaxID=658225 RepID=UPI00321F6D4B